MTTIPSSNHLHRIGAAVLRLPIRVITFLLVCGVFLALFWPIATQNDRCSPITWAACRSER